MLEKKTIYTMELNFGEYMNQGCQHEMIRMREKHKNQDINCNDIFYKN